MSTYFFSSSQIYQIYHFSIYIYIYIYTFLSAFCSALIDVPPVFPFICVCVCICVCVRVSGCVFVSVFARGRQFVLVCTYV